MTKEAEPSPQHLEWVIESRAENQRVSLRLLKIVKEFPNAGSSWEAQNLVAVGFSLWRAAFLADRTAKSEIRSTHAKEFLEKMLVDNAITYAQDRNSREWAFMYYIDNARYRLEIFEQNTRVKYFFKQELVPSKQFLNSRTRWDVLQQAFGRAVDEFSRQAKDW